MGKNKAQPPTAIVAPYNPGVNPGAPPGTRPTPGQPASGQWQPQSQPQGRPGQQSVQPQARSQTPPPPPPPKPAKQKSKSKSKSPSKAPAQAAQVQPPPPPVKATKSKPKKEKKPKEKKGKGSKSTTPTTTPTTSPSPSTSRSPSPKPVKPKKEPKPKAEKKAKPPKSKSKQKQQTPAPAAAAGAAAAPIVKQPKKGQPPSSPSPSRSPSPSTPPENSKGKEPPSKAKKKGCCSRLCGCGCCKSKCCKKKKGPETYPELPKPPASLAHLKDVSSFLLRTTREYVMKKKPEASKTTPKRDDHARDHNHNHSRDREGGDKKNDGANDDKYGLATKFDVYPDDSYRSRRKMYTAVEEVGKGCCCGCCCSGCKTCCLRTDRPFRFRILDRQKVHVFTIVRPCGCCCCMGSQFCGDMCGHGMRAELPDGTLIGGVKQKCCCGCCKPVYFIQNAVGNPRFKIQDPSCCGFCFCRRICCPPEQMPITATHDSLIWRSGDEIGTIGMIPPWLTWLERSRSACGTKSRSRSRSRRTCIPRPPPECRGRSARKVTPLQSLRADQYLQGVLPDEIVFWVEFPRKLDVRLKATMIGAALLMDFLHFDKDPCGFTQFCC